MRLSPKYKIETTLNEKVFGILLVFSVLVGVVIIPTWILIELFRLVGG